MSCSDIAHWLKGKGDGSELAGIRAVFREGYMIGVEQVQHASYFKGAGHVLLGGALLYGLYRAYKWFTEDREVSQ